MQTGEQEKSASWTAGPGKRKGEPPDTSVAVKKQAVRSQGIQGAEGQRV